MSTPKPTYLYKLIAHSAAPPDPLPDRLPLSALDQSSGFIHLSTARQIPGTLKHFFAADPRVYVLKLPYEPVERDIQWEDPLAQVCGERGAEGVFPHLYNGGQLGKAEVESVVVWERDDACWDERLKEAESWLVY